MRVCSRARALRFRSTVRFSAVCSSSQRLSQLSRIRDSMTMHNIVFERARTHTPESLCVNSIIRDRCGGIHMCVCACDTIRKVQNIRYFRHHTHARTHTGVYNNMYIHTHRGMLREGVSPWSHRTRFAP